MNTLPAPSRSFLTTHEVASRVGLTTDQLRRRLRKRPSLRAFFGLLGGQFVLSPDTLPAFQAALSSSASESTISSTPAA